MTLFSLMHWDLYAFINGVQEIKDNYSFWDEIADRIFLLCRNSINEAGKFM